MGKKTMLIIMLLALLAAIAFVFIVPDVRLSNGRYPAANLER